MKRKLKKAIAVIYFQIGVNVIGIPEIIKHYKAIQGFSQILNTSQFHR